MSVNRVFAEMIVADLEASVAWYERLLGRPADARPMDGLAEWHFAGTGGLQVFRDAGRAGGGALTLAVDNLAGFAAAVRGRGIAVGAITEGEQASFVAIADPDGNAITLAGATGPA